MSASQNASLSTDAELMTNYVAAVPVPAGSHFATVLDENRHAAVFCLSNDAVPKLQIIRHTSTGEPTLFDLKSCLQLPDDAKVQTFEVQQSSDLSLYLCVAYQNGAGDIKLALAKPFKVEDLKSDAKLAIIPGTASIGAVSSIFMTPVSAGAGATFPSIYIMHKNLQQTVSWGSDMTRIAIKTGNTSWEPKNDMTTPENTSGIIDIAPAVSVYGQGLFVLYKSQGKSKIYARFLRPDPDANDGSMINFVTSVMCPEDATCISSVFDKRHRSGLLIGASDGLRYLSPSESVQKNKPGAILYASNLLKNLVGLTTTQDGDHLSMWFSNDKGELGYVRTTSDQLGQGTPVLLLPAGQASSFSAAISQPDVQNGNLIWQRLVSNDDFGNLMLLEQCSDTGIWKKTPFYAPSATENLPVQSYTVTFRASDSNGNPIRDGSLFVTSSSAVTIICNGRNTILSSTGSWMNADHSGSLNLVVPTDSLAAQSITVSKIRKQNGESVPFSGATFDPGAKAMDVFSTKMQSINKADHLRAAKTQTGTSLFSGDVPDNDTLDQGISCLKTLQSAYTSLSAKDSPSVMLFRPMMHLAATPGSVANAIVDGLWEAWEYWKSQAKHAYDWFVETAGDVWRFVFKIGEDIQHFILDTAEKVCEVASWVFEKIKIVFDKVVEWVGFIFSWDDILQTKDTISSLITASLGLATDKVEWVAQKADGFFVDLLAKIDSLGVHKDLTGNLTPNAGNDQPAHSDVAKAQNSTSFNWMGERLKYGGAGTSTQVKTTTNSIDQADETWKSVFEPALDGISAAASKVAQDIRDAYNQKGLTSAQLMVMCKDILKLGVETIRGIVQSLLKLVKMMLQQLNKYGNESVSIPIFSSLYKSIANHDLTLFDAVSLILAIPTTIFTKMITGRAPPTFNGMNKTLLGQIVLGDLVDGKPVDPQVLLDFNTLTTGLGVSWTLTLTIVNALKLAWKTAAGGVDDAASIFAKSGGFFGSISIIFDMISALHAYPTDPKLPGLVYRQWICYMALFRGATNLLFLNSKVQTQNIEKGMLCYNMVSALIQFALEQASFTAEIDAQKTWAEYDMGVTSIGSLSSGMNAISAIGYWTAFMFRTEDPEVTALGVVVMEAAILGAAAMGGIMFKVQYDRKRRTRLVIPST